MGRDPDATSRIQITGSVGSQSHTSHPSALTEFLLARIAADGVVARHDRAEAVAYESLAPGVTGGFGRERRALAECEAKRRIVSECLEGLRYDIGCGEGHHGNFTIILAMLALPYADHPDYREEWKP